MTGPRPAERIDTILAELGRHWRSNPQLSLPELLSGIADRLGTELGQLHDTELMGALQLGVNAVPMDLPPGALAAPGDDWSRRPEPLDVLRLHISRRQVKSTRRPEPVSV